MKDTEKTFILTDGCAWEANKKNGTSFPHSIEVVDEKTGAIRYIKSGSRLRFVEGEITEARDQKTYNKLTSKPA